MDYNTDDNDAPFERIVPDCDSNSYWEDVSGHSGSDQLSKSFWKSSSDSKDWYSNDSSDEYSNDQLFSPYNISLNQQFSNVLFSFFR